MSSTQSDDDDEEEVVVRGGEKVEGIAEEDVVAAKVRKEESWRELLVLV